MKTACLRHICPSRDLIGRTRRVRYCSYGRGCRPDPSSRLSYARIAHATERDFQKIDFQRELPDLGLHLLRARTLFRSALLRRRHEHADRTVQQLRPPLRDLVGVHVVRRGLVR